MAKLTGFLPSIDNLTTNVKDVHSLMIVPIFGHRARMVMTKEHGVQEGMLKESKATRKPIAVIQFINKLEFKKIDEYDLAKIDAMSDLLGMSIDNACEHHSVINVRVGVQENFTKMQEFAEKSQVAADEMKDDLSKLWLCDVPSITNRLVQNDT